jgi:Ca2+/H+ antiporter, TMEM165/GDT1 family
MKQRWVVKGFAIVLVLLIVVAGFGQAVLQLWNWLMPDIFGLRPISFWQAVGLLGLSWLLFGGFGMFRGPGTGHWRHRMAMRLEQMPPEERERFREAMERRCGPMRPPAR